jgi:hypothetical protein
VRSGRAARRDRGCAGADRVVREDA